MRDHGYEINIGKDSFFEITGVSSDVMTAFSSRSAEIETALGERGTSRNAASAMERQIAALDTRQAKTAVDHATLVTGWRETAGQVGFGPDARLALMRGAESLAVSEAYHENRNYRVISQPREPWRMLRKN